MKPEFIGNLLVAELVFTDSPPVRKVFLRDEQGPLSVRDHMLWFNVWPYGHAGSRKGSNWVQLCAARDFVEMIVYQWTPQYMDAQSMDASHELHRVSAANLGEC